MLKSMTGYGRSKLQLDGKEYTIEIKSVNHRFIDINLKIPRNINYLEDRIRKLVLNSISRGKIDLSITYTNIGASSEPAYINEELASKYIKQLQKIASENGLSAEINVSDVLRLPDILISSNKDNDEEKIWNKFEEKISEAIFSFNNMRTIEGSKLSEDILNRIKRK